jgi:hypothetical protein
MSSRRLLVVIALLALVIVVGGGAFLLTRSDSTTATPPVATTPRLGLPPKGMTLGLQDDALLTSAEPLAVPTVKALMPRLIRYNIVWSDVAPTKPAAPGNPADPAYEWTNADKLIALAKTLGASVLFTIVDAPKWANGGATPEHVPTDAADFGTFCGVVAQRYPTVGRFTIWNEPNRGQFLQPQGAGGSEAPTTLANLAKACIPAIHAKSRQARVAIGPIASRGGQGGLAPIPFLAAYRAAGGPRPDGIALNPYLEGQAPLFVPTERPADGAVTVRNLDWLEGLLKQAYGTTMPIWLTEFAVRTVPPVTNLDQATQLRQTVSLVRTHYPYVPLLIWFLLRDQGPHDYWRSGLVDTAWHKKPAFSVFRSLS